MNTYEILTHLVCNLYDESTELVSIISAGNDEEAIRIAKEKMERNGWETNESMRSVRVLKNGAEIATIKEWGAVCKWLREK